MAVTAKIVDIVKCYAPNSHSTQDAKIEIIEKQKQLSQEKKAIRANLRKYKPQIDIYKEMRKLETTAYLYDLAGYEEYKAEYLEYKALSKRLEENYGKSIAEVASFYEDQMMQIDYASAQKEELSLQYKALINYERAERRNLTQDVQLFDAVGHSKAKREADYGVFSSRLVFITAKENENIMLRVMTSPDIVNGKNTVTTTVTVLSKEGDVIEEFSSADMSGKEFNRTVNEIKYQNNFINCTVYENETDARYALAWEAEKADNISVKGKSEEVQDTIRRKSR